MPRALRDTTRAIPTLAAPPDTSGYARRVQRVNEGRRVTARRPPSFGFAGAPRFSGGDSSLTETFPRSYPDRLAEAGWITDTDFGFEGLERYMFSPGSPRPPSISLDGFPVDLGTQALSSFDAWGGEPARSAGAWAPVGPSVPAPGGAVDFDRRPAGDDRLLTRVSLHGNDVGGSDALVQFARHSALGGWSAAAGIRKIQDPFFSTDLATLVDQFRERGLTFEGSRSTSWGAWRAAFLSVTSDLRLHDLSSAQLDTIVSTRREQYRLGTGAAFADSVISFSMVLASSGTDRRKEARESVGLRVAPPGLPANAAIVVGVSARDRSPGARSTASIEASGADWQAEAGLEAGDSPRVLAGSFAVERSPGRGVHFRSLGTVRAELGGAGGASGRLFRVRLEPECVVRSQGATATLAIYLEQDRALGREVALPGYSTLLVAAVDESHAYGARANLDLPGPLHTRLGGSALFQHTRDERGRRLIFQPPYSAHGFVAWSGTLPLLPFDAHLRLVANGEGPRLAEGDRESEAHATLDFEAVLKYESARFEFGAYNFTNLPYESTVLLPARTSLAPVYGRSLRFGVTWDLWD